MEQIRMLIWEAAVVIGALIRPAAKSIRENSGLAVISLVLAFGLWIFVTDAENPEQNHPLGFSVPIRPVNVPANVVVTKVGAGPVAQEVAVEVRVEENTFDSLTKEDFQATMDLTGTGVGEYSRRIDVQPLTTRGNLRVVDWDPHEVKVTLAQLVSKSLSVEVEVSKAPSDFQVSQTKPDKDTAVVSGPQEQVNQAAKVVAPIDAEGRTDSFDAAVRLEARNQQGELVGQVQVEPATMDVHVELEQISFGRALAVTPQITGTPRAGYISLGPSVEPAVVTVFGPQAFIEQAASILTQPVDIEDETGDVTRTVSLDLPPGTSVRGGISVTVKVKISPVPGQQVFAMPVSVDNLADNLKVAGTLPAVQVFLSGPAPDLLELDPSDIKATIDLGGKDAGTHRVGVKVTAPNKFEVRSISPQEIDITLERR
jgi:YbbR domain-containing protein